MSDTAFVDTNATGELITSGLRRHPGGVKQLEYYAGNNQGCSCTRWCSAASAIR